MSQAEILNLLKKNENKWISGLEIGKIIKKTSTNRSLATLREYNEVLFEIRTRKEKVKHHVYYYKYKPHSNSN